MKNIKTMLCGVALATAAAAPALAFPIGNGGTLIKGVPLLANGTFDVNGNLLFGSLFTLDRDVTIGSGWSLKMDTFGSYDLGTDTEIALYSADGHLLYAINDDFEQGSVFDAYLGFGDAPQSSNPFNGTTVQGDITNALELLAGQYLVVVGPYNTTWDQTDAQITQVSYSGPRAPWVCSVLLIPAPGSFALLGLGTLVIGGRRRRA